MEGKRMPARSSYSFEGKVHFILGGRIWCVWVLGSVWGCMRSVRRGMANGVVGGHTHDPLLFGVSGPRCRLATPQERHGPRSEVFVAREMENRVLFYVPLLTTVRVVQGWSLYDPRYLSEISDMS
jgi:hypothetical protein